MIYAIDFDGTLCFDEYPRIGAPRPDVLDFAKRIRRAGDRLILSVGMMSISNPSRAARF